jgi:hypothetical protein
MGLHTFANLPRAIARKAKNVFRYATSQDYRDRRDWERHRRNGELVFGKTGGVVVAGPFKGLQYVESGRGSSLGPKLLGTYELELRDIIESIIARGYKTIINIGAGEGYYGVGLAKRMPDSRLVCFDAEPINQEQIKMLARRNGVEAQIDVRGLCDDMSLAQAIGDSHDVLVICDIEGAEVEVLRPDAVPSLKRADLLVEMHDIVRKGCSDAIRARFAGTHDIDVIPTRKRTDADFPAAGVDLEPKHRQSCMDEGRGPVPMTFFWMRARTAPSPRKDLP